MVRSSSVNKNKARALEDRNTHWVTINMPRGRRPGRDGQLEVSHIETVTLEEVSHSDTVVGETRQKTTRPQIT